MFSREVGLFSVRAILGKRKLYADIVKQKKLSKKPIMIRSVNPPSHSLVIIFGQSYCNYFNCNIHLVR